MASIRRMGIACRRFRANAAGRCRCQRLLFLRPAHPQASMSKRLHARACKQACVLACAHRHMMRKLTFWPEATSRHFLRALLVSSAQLAPSPLWPPLPPPSLCRSTAACHIGTAESIRWHKQCHERCCNASETEAGLGPELFARVHAADRERHGMGSPRPPPLPPARDSTAASRPCRAQQYSSASLIVCARLGWGAHRGARHHPVHSCLRATIRVFSSGQTKARSMLASMIQLNQPGTKLWGRWHSGSNLSALPQRQRQEGHSAVLATHLTSVFGSLAWVRLSHVSHDHGPLSAHWHRWAVGATGPTDGRRHLQARSGSAQNICILYKYFSCQSVSGFGNWVVPAVPGRPVPAPRARGRVRVAPRARQLTLGLHLMHARSPTYRRSSQRTSLPSRANHHRLKTKRSHLPDVLVGSRQPLTWRRRTGTLYPHRCGQGTGTYRRQQAWGGPMIPRTETQDPRPSDRGSATSPRPSVRAHTGRTRCPYPCIILREHQVRQLPAEVTATGERGREVNEHDWC